MWAECEILCPQNAFSGKKNSALVTFSLKNYSAGSLPRLRPVFEAVAVYIFEIEAVAVTNLHTFVAWSAVAVTNCAFFRPAVASATASCGQGRIIFFQPTNVYYCFL